MSATSQSLGLSMEISKDLKSSLKSTTDAALAFDQHKLVKLTPLGKRGLQEPSSKINKELEATLKEDEGNAKDHVKGQPLEYAYDSEEDSLLEVSAPRPLEELARKDDESELSDDELSYLPPPSLPVVLVHIERLCGYVPKSDTEFEAVAGQVKLALQEDEDFDVRATELFEMGMARHGDNAVVDAAESFSWLQVNYPEFICTSDDRVLSTARVWKKFFRMHKIDVVQRIINHLKNCDRSLVWKSDMHDELCTLAKSEDAARREAELDMWRTEGRKARLDKLYQVRETFNHRLEMARIQSDNLEDAREELIIQQHGKGLQALDLESNVFHVDTKIKPSELLGMEEHAIDDGLESDETSREPDEEADDERSIDSDEDGAVDLDTNEESKDNANNIDAAVLKKNRRRRVRRKHRKLLENAAQQALEKSKLEKALAEEEQIRENCTSQDLRMAQAAVQSLEVRMQQVDDLLEAMQEDEWADEEDGFKPNPSTTDGCNSTEKMSLLDQILAMVLGTLSPASNIDPDEAHFHFIRSEHREIVSNWKRHFSRLPMPKAEEQWDTSSPELIKQRHNVPSETLRAELGITDNGDVEWDIGDDSDIIVGETSQVVNSSTHQSDTPVPSQLRAGLRPGGSLRPGGNIAN